MNSFWKFVGYLIGTLIVIGMIFIEGFIMWFIVNGIVWVFNIDFHLNYFPQAVILGFIWSLLTFPFRKRD